jgi:hypothetical protein
VRWADWLAGVVRFVRALLCHRGVDAALAFVFALVAPPVLESTYPGQVLDSVLRSFLHAFATMHVGG